MLAAQHAKNVLYLFVTHTHVYGFREWICQESHLIFKPHPHFIAHVFYVLTLHFETTSVHQLFARDAVLSWLLLQFAHLLFICYTDLCMCIITYRSWTSQFCLASTLVFHQSCIKEHGFIHGVLLQITAKICWALKWSRSRLW